MKKAIFAALILAPMAAVAQPVPQQPDPMFLQKAIAALQNQRNAALDGQAVCEARSSAQVEETVKLNAQLTAANAKIKELQDKYEKPAAPPVAQK